MAVNTSVGSNDSPAYQVFAAESIATSGNAISTTLGIEGYRQISVGVISSSSSFTRRLQTSFDGTNWMTYQEESGINGSGGGQYSKNYNCGGFRFARLQIVNADAATKTFDAWIGLGR